MSENAEFDFIFNSFDKIILLEISQIKIDREARENKLANLYQLNLHLSTVIANIHNYGNGYNQRSVEYSILLKGQEFLGLSPKTEQEKELYSFHMKGFPKIYEQLLTYGLIENYTYTEKSFENSHVSQEGCIH